MPTKEQVLAEIDRLFGIVSENRAAPGYSVTLVADTRTIIEVAAGRDSHFVEGLDGILRSTHKQFQPNMTVFNQRVGGLLQSLRHAVENGFLSNVAEETRSATYGDFLSEADSLLSEAIEHGNKALETAAAVLAGGVLEEHLRRLCMKHEINTEQTDKKGRVQRRPVSALNADLQRANYGPLEAGNVQTWYRIRTHAAHAEYDKYDADHVQSMIMNLRSFIAKYPA